MRHFEAQLDVACALVVGVGDLVVTLEGDRGDDGDPFLALFYEAAELAPGVEAGDASRVRSLVRNEHHVSEAVGVKATGGCEVSDQSVAAARLKCVGQLLES